MKNQVSNQTDEAQWLRDKIGVSGSIRETEDGVFELDFDIPPMFKLFDMDCVGNDLTLFIRKR